MWNRAVRTDSSRPNSEGPPGSTVVLRPRDRWWLTGAFAAIALLLGGNALVDAVRGNPEFDWRLFAVAAVLCAALAVRYLYVRVTVGIGGLEVHNLVSGWREPWSEIVAFTTTTVRGRKSSMTVPAMVLRSGRTHDLTALESRDNWEVDASIERLRSLAPPGAQPDFVPDFQLQQFLAERCGIGPASGPTRR
jgi:hypothetical protein